MASTEEEIIRGEQVLIKRENVQKWKNVQEAFYDKKKGEILGHNMAYWQMSFMFYVLFYGILTIFFLVCMCLLMVSVDLIIPGVKYKESPIKFNPGLAMRPVPDFDTNLIRFQQGNPASYKPYSDHIKAFLDQYEHENQDSENSVSCTDGKEDTPKMNAKVCFFDLIVLGDECTWQNDYGYDEGQPCLMFKLNKVYDWRAEPYQPDEVPEEIKDIYQEGHIPITCYGENPADHENIGNITMFPPMGFPAHFYPFLNQYGFRSPLVMVKFKNPVNGMLLNIVCKAWAKNIKHHRNDQQGLVRFHLLID